MTGVECQLRAPSPPRAKGLPCGPRETSTVPRPGNVGSGTARRPCGARRGIRDVLAVRTLARPAGGRTTVSGGATACLGAGRSETALKIVCSGHLVRHPVGGLSWHHLQYLVGFKRQGHDVTFFEDYGWPTSCYDPEQNVMTSDPSYGISYLRKLLEPHGMADDWCYLAEDGTAHGMAREQLAQLCRESDIYFTLSNLNWIPELEHCRRRVLVDTDPVLTQIGGHGIGKPFSWYDTLFTYGENVHQAGCTMPTAGAHWLPTRQPVVLDLWPITAGDPSAPFTSVMNWSSVGEREYEGRVYGEKPREFGPFFTLPRDTGECHGARDQRAGRRPRAPARRRVAAGGCAPGDAHALDVSGLPPGLTRRVCRRTTRVREHAVRLVQRPKHRLPRHGATGHPAGHGLQCLPPWGRWTVAVPQSTGGDD